MHPRDELVPFEAFDAEITKLEKLLIRFGIDVGSSSDLARGTRLAFATLYFSVYAYERPEMSLAAAIGQGAVLAGIGDLAAKINRAEASAGGDAIRPHLLNMIKGAVRMNADSSILDDAANKNTELYVGCLALGAGMAAEMEDPVGSAGGKNPDLLLEDGGTEWAIAVKTPHSAAPRSIYANIESAVKQIERSARNGLVLVNLKNIVDRSLLIVGSPYPSVEDAKLAVRAQTSTIIDRVQADTTVQDWTDLFQGRRARSLVAFMSQVTVSAKAPDGREMFVPIKEMRARPLPPLKITSLEELTGIDAQARGLLEKLNEELQRNPTT